MNPTRGEHPQRIRHAGPPLGIVSSVFVLLFLAGLYPVTIFGGQPSFPGPWESQDPRAPRRRAGSRARAGVVLA